MQIQFLKNKKNFHKKHLQFNANLYWKLAVCEIFAVAIFSFFFSYYLLVKINEELVLPIDDSGRTDTVNKQRIDKVLEYFFIREQKSSEILNSPAPVIDPSL